MKNIYFIKGHVFTASLIDESFKEGWLLVLCHRLGYLSDYQTFLFRQTEFQNANYIIILYLFGGVLSNVWIHFTETVTKILSSHSPNA